MVLGFVSLLNLCKLGSMAITFAEGIAALLGSCHRERRLKSLVIIIEPLHHSVLRAPRVKGKLQVRRDGGTGGGM